MYLDTGILRRRMSNLSDDELLSIVTTRRPEYRQVAIDVASEELMQRAIPLPTTNHPRLNTAPRPTSPVVLLLLIAEIALVILAILGRAVRANV
jgi:hypothetical protein